MNKGDELVEAFYRTFNESDQDERVVRGSAILAELCQFAGHDPRYLGWSYLFEGILVTEEREDWGESERLFRKALAANDATMPLLLARTQLALAVICAQQDRWLESLAFCRQSLPIFRELNLPVDIAMTLRYVAIARYEGYLHGEFGESVLAEALEATEEALVVLDAAEQTTEIISLRSMTWSSRGNVFQAMHRWDEAIAAYRQHKRITEGLGYRCRVAVPLHQIGIAYHHMGAEYTDDAFAAYSEALALFRECGYKVFEVELLSDRALLSKRVGDMAAAMSDFDLAINCIEAMREGFSTESARAGYLAIARQTFDHAILLCLEVGQPQKAFDLVERARSRAFLDLLAAGSPELERESAMRPLSLAEVQARLPQDTLLVEYFTTGVVEASDRGRTQAALRVQFPAARTLIFAVTKDDLRVVDAGLSPNDLLPARLGGAVERQFLSRRVLSALYEKLVESISDLCRGKHRLIIIPHGPLHYTPFAALLAGDGQPFLRESGPDLVFGPSASALFLKAEPVRRKGAGLLALGYNGSGIDQLHFAEGEARAIAALTGGESITGDGSKKQRLLAKAGDFRWLHFSCHGYFDPSDPLNSALVLSPDEILTAQEVISNLRLNAELVTLSACESGLSRVRRGDELMGLVRAFMLAGASAVVATQWRVDERSTQLLMQEFYTEVMSGCEYAQALRKAQTRLRERDEGRFADPFFWAPFVIFSSGRAG
ncbi:MAG: CHAT domain-containing protein [Caldilineales bacterium]|nr:CHAT domain-containing protein [Caldilineales bacterium]